MSMFCIYIEEVIQKFKKKTYINKRLSFQGIMLAKLVFKTLNII